MAKGARVQGLLPHYQDNGPWVSIRKPHLYFFAIYRFAGCGGFDPPAD
jgi:hypothetical protein